jgi:hypothetical protein
MFFIARPPPSIVQEHYILSNLFGLPRKEGIVNAAGKKNDPRKGRACLR